MTIKELEDIIFCGENNRVEFKSWKKAKSKKDIIDLVVKELVALANSNGGVVLLGVEDDGKVTGCEGYDCQNIIEAIYDKTRPNMYVEIEDIEYKKLHILVLSVGKDNNIYATSAGACYRRLGKNSKPYYPNDRDGIYQIDNTDDFSSKVMIDSSEEDIDKLAIYKLKEDLKLRDSSSTLIMLEDRAFLKDLGLVVEYNGEIKLTVAGMLFVGKDKSIAKHIPQAEVIYLHYSENNLEEYDARIDMKQSIVKILDRLTEKIEDCNHLINVQIGLFRLEIYDYPKHVFQEALLNALSHRNYESMGSIYVKHYPDKLVIENPGGFLDGITEKNIITHPSLPRNKLIAETLQRLRYVQRTGQGVDIIFREMVSMGKPYPRYTDFGDAISLTICNSVIDLEYVKYIVEEQSKQQKILSLAELMIIRYLTDNRRIKLSEAKDLTQVPLVEVKKCCKNLIKMGIIEVVGREYMLSARVYDAIKNKIEYTQDKVVQYIKARDRILDYLGENDYITNIVIQELCNYTKQQSRTTINKMLEEGYLKIEGKGRATRYILK